MENFKPARLSSLDSLVQLLDSLRVYLIRLSLRPALFRQLYLKSHLRLSTGMIVSTIFYLPFAILKPHILLALGPLIFGYPHLVASYRFTAFNKYGLYIFVTLIAIILHVSKIGFFHIEQLPFGVWQIVVAAGALIVSGQVRIKGILLCLFLTILLINLSWQEPIIFVGGSLILHNWVAFIYWIIVAKDRPRRFVAILSTLLFFVIHLLVLNGNLDGFIPMQNGRIQFGGESMTTGWYLASWAQDPVVWYRLLILYTFGLSLHYFVWLKAIPESINTFEHPHNFRLILKNLRQDLGKKALILTILFALGGTILWLFSTSKGSAFYFEIAILHGALELVFLIPKLLPHKITKLDKLFSEVE